MVYIRRDKLSLKEKSGPEHGGPCHHVEQKKKLIKMVLEESKHDTSEYSLQGELRG